MPNMRIMYLGLAFGILAAPAGAHPHIFIEAGVKIEVNAAGQVTGIWLTWTYDEFFSFMLSEDLGLDGDGDLVMTDAELETLAAQVLEWPAEFGGDLYLTQRDAPLVLGERDEASVSYEGGKVVERHYRPLDPPMDATWPIAVQVYDPFYYVAYEVSPDIGLIGGEGCTAELRKADLNAAYSLVDELLYGRPASDVGPDEAFPEVGEAFSDTVYVTCGG